MHRAIIFFDHSALYSSHMNYRTLGKTGLKVAEVGFGTWQIANDPDSWVGADINESFRSLRTYVEHGGNFIDTAWIYGYSEKIPEAAAPFPRSSSDKTKESGKSDEIIVASNSTEEFSNCAQGTAISEMYFNDHVRKMH